jgi:gentisate 1,2-dioxygenase
MHRAAPAPWPWTWPGLELVSPEKAGRVIFPSNPGRRDVSAAVGWLYTGLQVMNPGEVASARRDRRC